RRRPQRLHRRRQVPARRRAQHGSWVHRRPRGGRLVHGGGPNLGAHGAIGTSPRGFGSACIDRAPWARARCPAGRYMVMIRFTKKPSGIGGMTALLLTVSACAQVLGIDDARIDPALTTGL